jgi:hypothetical protein
MKHGVKTKWLPYVEFHHRELPERHEQLIGAVLCAGSHARARGADTGRSSARRAFATCLFRPISVNLRGACMIRRNYQRANSRTGETVCKLRGAWDGAGAESNFRPQPRWKLWAAHKGVGARCDTMIDTGYRKTRKSIRAANSAFRTYLT